MCLIFSSPMELCSWWARFYLQLHTSLCTNMVRTAQNSLAQMHEQRPSDRLRTPLLSLHVKSLKPMRSLKLSVPRQKLWLVG